VTNDGTEPLKVMVYAADQKVDDRGNITYVTPTHADLQSLTLPSSWTTIKMPANSKSLGNVPYLDMAPGDRIPIKFSFVIPPTVPPGDHNVLIFFESFEPPKPGEGSQSVISGRLGSRVQLRVKGQLVDKLEVRPFVVPGWVLGNTVPYQFVVRNEGNTDQRVGARVTLFDRVENQVDQKTAIDGLTVFAGTNYESSGTVRATGPFAIGPYSVRLEVSPVDDAGHATNAGANTITEQHTVWLVPMWFIVAVIVVLVLIVFGIVWAIVSGSRKRRHKAAEEAYQRGLGDAARNRQEWENEEE